MQHTRFIMGARKTISVGLACGLIQLPSDTYWNLLMLKNQRNFSSGISSILPPEGNISRRDAPKKSDGRQCPGKLSQCPVVPRNFCIETKMVVSMTAVDQFSPVSSVPTHAKKLLHRNQHGSEGDSHGPVLPCWRRIPRRQIKSRNIGHSHVFKSKPENAFFNQLPWLLYSVSLPSLFFPCPQLLFVFNVPWRHLWYCEALSINSSFKKQPWGWRDGSADKVPLYKCDAQSSDPQHPI